MLVTNMTLRHWKLEHGNGQCVVVRRHAKEANFRWAANAEVGRP